MKKSLMLLGNVLIILVIMAFIMLYVSSERQKMLVSQTEAFKNMTVAMESVTTNYLVGEQQVCRSWSNYINASDMTAEDAINYVRKSLTAPEIMAHILFAGEDGLTGFSTAPKADGDYTVSYNDLDIFSNGFDDLLREKNKVNVTRAYINPINAIQSIGFGCSVNLRDGESGQMVKAVLLRIILSLRVPSPARWSGTEYTARRSAGQNQRYP